MTVPNKRRLAKHKIKTMSHHSQHYFIIQYIFWRCTAVNEFYQMTQMRAAGHVIANRIDTDE